MRAVLHPTHPPILSSPTGRKSHRNSRGASFGISGEVDPCGLRVDCECMLQTPIWGILLTKGPSCCILKPTTALLLNHAFCCQWCPWQWSCSKQANSQKTQSSSVNQFELEHSPMALLRPHSTQTAFLLSFPLGQACMAWLSNPTSTPFFSNPGIFPKHSPCLLAVSVTASHRIRIKVLRWSSRCGAKPWKDWKEENDRINYWFKQWCSRLCVQGYVRGLNQTRSQELTE